MVNSLIPRFLLLVDLFVPVVPSNHLNSSSFLLCCFEKRKSSKGELFHVNGKLIEIVDSFTNLGIVFNHTGTIQH